MDYYIYQALVSQGPDGGYDVEFPDLPGCFTFGESYEEAARMAADAAKTYVASLLAHGDDIPASHVREVPGASMLICFEADASYVVRGETVSAAEASRMLGVSAGRVTHMLDSGILQGYRRGRRTYVTVESIEKRAASHPGAGRPKTRTASC